MTNYINVDRKFSELSDDIEIDDDSFDVDSYLGISSGKTWDDLLKLNRVVILARAGAGKTEEIQHQTQILRSQGKSSFFFRLELLATDFEMAFETGDLKEFEEWIKTDQPGWFFLDSVDEARLTGAKQFELAIKRLSTKLSGNLQRAHIYITSRDSVWRPYTDPKFIEEWLPYIDSANINTDKGDESEINKAGKESYNHKHTQEAEKIKPAVYSLIDLDIELAKRFISAYEITDVDNFLKEVQQAEAVLYMGRPQDLIELINYWIKYQKITNHAELIKESIKLKLVEHDPDRAGALPLSKDDAMYGAEIIAAAVTFTQQSQIMVPDRNNTSEVKGNSLDIQELLKSWDMPKIGTILQRPIFDKEIYRTVRFHHRSEREYLTARWVHRLLSNGHSRQRIENVFFKIQYGIEVVTDSLRPILSWLLIFDDKFHDKVSKISPELFIQGGDPVALPISIRKAMLIKLCKHYVKSGNRRNLSFDINEIKRFSHADLADTIQNLYDEYSDIDEIRELLLRMIWQGEIAPCSGIALNAAVDKSMDVYTRIYGIRCIDVIGSNKQKKHLAKAVLEEENLSLEKIVAEAISTLSDNYFTINNIVTLISRLEIKDHYSISSTIASLKKYTKETCAEESLLHWVKALLLLITQPPFKEQLYCRISKRYNWLLSIAMDAIERASLFDRDILFDENIIQVISLSQKAKDYDIDLDDNPAASIAKLVHETVELKRKLFWHDVHSVRRDEYAGKDKNLIYWWQAGLNNTYWKFSESDFDNVLKDIKQRPIMDDKLVALSLAFEIYRESGRNRKYLYKLKKTVADVNELKDALHLFLHPPKMTAIQKEHKQRQASWKRRQKIKKAKDAENERKWKTWLTDNTHILRDTSIASEGKVWNATDYLIGKIRKTSDNNSRWTNSNWQSLIPEFGNRVSEALRDGCIEYWRLYSPELRSDGDNAGNTIPNALIVGLSGIAMEASMSQEWANKLTDDEVKLACRYAIREMNSFPKWLQSLWVEHRSAVQETLLHEIEWELKEYKGDTPCHYVLSGVSWGADWIKPYIANDIVELLEKFDPVQNDSIERALKIVLYSPGLNINKLTKLIETILDKKLSVNRTALWLAAWMLIDSKEALKKLSVILLEFKKPSDSTNFIMLFLQALIGGRHDRLKSIYADYYNVAILTELIKTIYQHVRTSDDIDRSETGAYSPNIRDHAQNVRGRLLQKLFDIPGKETYLSLLALASELTDNDIKKWCETLAKRRAVIDADISPWKLEDIISFTDSAENKPRTNKELYLLIHSRLNDLKADLEDGDSSIANFLKLESAETEHRKFIGQWLRERSCNYYSVPQEEELADGTRPDIRIHGSGFDGPVPIELKIADNKWTLANHKERLENQLCGKYLRDIRSNFGIYLVIYLGNKKYWKRKNQGEKLSFNEMINILKNHAISLAASHTKIERVEVISIDLSKRSNK